MALQAPARIIVVDDDASVLEALEMILTGAGHTVRGTARGADALRWLDEAPCDLLIIDLTMPEMDGPALYRGVLMRWPVGGPRILFMSGHDDPATSHPDPALRSVPILVKPFNLGELFAAVDRVLTAA